VTVTVVVAAVTILGPFVNSVSGLTVAPSSSSLISSYVELLLTVPIAAVPVP